jgi:antitoxin HicB
MTADYPAILRPLSAEEGGGYLIEYPDLPGCMSDGETAEEALHNGQDALQAYLKDLQASGESIPMPRVQKPVDNGASVRPVASTRG